MDGFKITANPRCVGVQTDRPAKHFDVLWWGDCGKNRRDPPVLVPGFDGGLRAPQLHASCRKWTNKRRIRDRERAGPLCPSFAACGYCPGCVLGQISYTERDPHWLFGLFL